MNIKDITNKGKSIEIDLGDIQDEVLYQEVSDIWLSSMQYIDKQILLGLGVPLTILLDDRINISGTTYTLSDIQDILETDNDNRDTNNGKENKE